MKYRLITYGFIFAASAAVGYLSVKPASAATTVTVSFHAAPVHYGYHPPIRYYGPVPRYYPRSYFAPRHHYRPHNPAAHMRWHHRDWDRHDHRHGFQGKSGHRDHDRHGHDDRDRHDRGRHDGDRRHR